MLNQFANNYSDCLKRFHLSIFLSVLFFFFAIFLNHTESKESGAMFKILLTLGYSMLISIGLKLIVESYEKSLIFYYILSFWAFLIILYFLLIDKNSFLSLEIKFINNINPNFLFFFPLSSFFFIFSAPFFKKSKTNDQFSTFHYKIWSQFFLSFLSSMILWIGCGIILLSLDSLLKIKIESKIYLDLFLFSFVLFFPVFFLSGISKNFNEVKKEYSRSVKFILNNICIPILIIFSFIFILYILRMIFLDSFKFYKKFFYIFSFYFIFGISTYILSQPFRNENKIIFFFYQNFFKFIILPEVFSCIIFIPYIINYRFTTLRYLGLLFLILIFTSIFIKFLSKKMMSKIYIGIVFVGFILSIIPWNL
jgi:hypothetical protein